ncbi:MULTISPECIES: YigZ family protein [Bacillus]|uniref:YigZ family protein n=5 Tax=Bacillaceae TaxID=186817 RepID=A0A0M2EC43_BACIA|nr:MULTISPECIES: YigZ family protein [Bacillus]MBW4854278.1 YigZ family protein [Bacillaceae bacterium]MBY0191363.1 YigZ family protein [Bacillus aerophilus]PNU25047.1 YigZ family protein [Bacillus stratosphericus]ABV63854.1 IMPACT family protein [Bacillus pumilus SAFR-032]AIZ61691.1 IMPACT family member YvyE [Bacillus sp. WP8]
MLNRYLTVKSRGEHEIVIEKSRFICHIQRAVSEEEAQAFIQSIKKQHWNATHNCSAYLIGEHDLIQKANDDGEPSGTAGVPMLEVLKKRKLKDTVVVVTRYFGGIKLGAGGLIRAYGKSVSEAINHVGMVERCLMRTMHTTIDYTWLGKVENELRASSFQLKEIHYAEDVIFETYVEETQTEQFIEWMTELTNGKSVTKEGELIYLEKDIGPIKETDEWHNE